MGVPANELRIGNWVTYGSSDQTTEQVYDIWFDVDEGVRYINDLIIDLIHPIPLTPEILLACGFDEESSDYRKHILKIYSGHNEFWFWVANSGVNTEIKYLHQLQNLYFALTGEELNYSPGEQK